MTHQSSYQYAIQRYQKTHNKSIYNSIALKALKVEITQTAINNRLAQQTMELH